MFANYSIDTYTILRWALSIVATIVSAFIVVGTVLSTTATGFYILFYCLSSWYDLPITIGVVKGSLIRGIVIDNIRYDRAINAGKTHLQWASIQSWGIKISIDDVSYLSSALPSNLYKLEKLVAPVLEHPSNIELFIAHPSAPFSPMAVAFRFYDRNYSGDIYTTSAGVYGALSSDAQTSTSFSFIDNHLSVTGDVIFKDLTYQVHADVKVQDFTFPLGEMHISHLDRRLVVKSHREGDCTFLEGSAQGPDLNISLSATDSTTRSALVSARGKDTRFGHIGLKHWQLETGYDEGADNPISFSLQADNIALNKVQFDDISLRYTQSNLDMRYPDFVLYAKSKALFYDNIFIIDQLNMLINKGDSSATFSLSNQQGFPFSMQWHAKKQQDYQWIAQPSQFSIAGSNNILTVLPETVLEFSHDYLALKSNTGAKKYPISANLIYYFGSNMWLEVALSDFPVELMPLSLLNIFDLYPTNFSGLANGHFSLSKPDDSDSGSLDGKINVHVDKGILNQIAPDLPLASDLYLSSAKTLLTLHDHVIEVSTNALANDGSVDLSGRIELDYRHPAFAFHIDGKNVRFNQPNNGFITLDTDININYKHGINSTTGQLHITEASYHNQQWKTALRLTDDISVVSSDTTDAPITTPVAYDLKIDLGQRAMLHAFGFHGQVLGDIHLMQKPSDQRFIAEGSVHMKDGILLIYGQQLPLALCRLNWYQALLNKPHLDMQIRTQSTSTSLGGTQEYGINVAGNIDDLKIDFYSEPRAMTNVEILTHLLLDKHQYHREYTESIDSLLEELHLEQINGNDLSLVLEVLASIKRAMFFDRIELDSGTETHHSGAKYEEMEVLLTRMLNEHFALSMRLNSADPRKNQFGFDAILSKELRLRSYFAQNPSNLNFELYYENSF